MTTSSYTVSKVFTFTLKSGQTVSLSQEEAEYVRDILNEELPTPSTVPTSSPPSTPSTSLEDPEIAESRRISAIPRTKEGALQLVDEGWIVRGPYLYGSKKNGQTPCLRLQHPKHGTQHTIFALDEGSREEVLAIAKMRGQFKGRVVVNENVYCPTDVEQQPATQDIPSIPSISNTSSTPDILVPETPTIKIAVKCRKCGNKIIKRIVNNRHAQNVFKQTAAFHYDETGHKGSCYLEEVK